jgi:hypothetical protein
MKVFQIYFNDEQLLKLDYTPYYNFRCTPFFENSVIRELVEAGEHFNTDYFGVVSYQLRDKVRITKKDWANVKNIANTSVSEFTPGSFERELLKGKPDAMSFQRHCGHDPVSFANQFHPNFSKYFKEIMDKAGYNWQPGHIDNIFYCNYFVAKPDIYEKYVKEMLAPCMDIMKDMPELMGNSKYPKVLPDHLKKSFGVDHYPYHAFLCERMFSFFAHINNLKCLHY